MNTITFSKADFPNLDCEVGKQENLAITITPTRIDGDVVTATVDSAEYGEPTEEEAQDTEEMPMKGAMMSKSPPKAIVAIGIPGKGKGY